MEPVGGPVQRSALIEGFVTLGCAGLLTAGILAAVGGGSQASRLVNLVNGHGWVVNNAKGEIILANGETGTADLSLGVVSSGGHQLQIVQAGHNADLVDQKTGQVGTI
jgi:hypothetical protein